MALKQDKNNKLVSKILAQKRKDVTGGLLELASSEESTNLLMRYSTRESDVKNISAFKSYSYQKLPLQMTFKDVMGSAAPPELEKKEMATRIVERINAMLPIFCCKCSDFYCELDQKETSIKLGVGYTDQKNNFIKSEFLWVKNSISRHNIKKMLV